MPSSANINLSNINIGQPNQTANSDSLWLAFNKAQNNFSILSNTASQWKTINAGNGIGVYADSNTTLRIENQGIRQIIPGDNISISNLGSGVVQITSVGGGGNGNGGGTITGVSITGATGVAVNPNVVLQAGGNANFTIGLSNSGVTAGTYRFPNVVVDQYGRITSIANGNAGTVTSVGFVNGNGISVTGGPVTSAGNVTITNTGVTRLTVGAGFAIANATSPIGVANSLTGDVILTLTGGGGGGGGTVTLIETRSNGDLLMSTTYPVSDGATSAQITTAGTIYFRIASALPNVTSLGTLSNLTVSGNAAIGGNLTVTGNLNYINSNVIYLTDPTIELGGGPNGAPLTTNDGKDRGMVLHYYNGTPIDAFMGWDTGNGEFAVGSNVSETSANSGVYAFNTFGNLRGSFWLGNGVNVNGNISGANLTLSSNATISGNANIATLIVTGTSNFTGNLNVVNINPSGVVNAIGNVSGGNLTTAGNVVAVGNVNGGSAGITGTATIGNIIANGNIFANSGTVGGNLLLGALTTNSSSQPNITSLGNSLTIGNITSVGNVTVIAFANTSNLVVTNNLFSNGTTYLNGNLISTSNIFANSGTVRGNLLTGTLTTAAQPNITSIGNLTSLTVSATVTAGNLSTSGSLLAGNANVGNISSNTRW